MKSMIAKLWRISSFPNTTCTTETSLTTVHTQTVSAGLVTDAGIQTTQTSTFSPSLKVAAWNCRRLNNALPCIEILAEDHDVIVLSEHWLWPFEINKFLNLHPHMSGLAIADRRLTPECHLSKGCGGIGILWRKSLKVTPVSGNGQQQQSVCLVSQLYFYWAFVYFFQRDYYNHH